MSPPTSFDILNRPAYRLLPLQDTQIRLIRLLPASTETDIIKVILFRHEYEDASTAYDALSYRWGDPNDRCRIIVNDQDFWITRTLHSALAQFRTTGERLVWADGICIDQSNILERNHQVALMKDIFSTAKHVRVYLGEAVDDAELAMDLIARCSHDHIKKPVQSRILEDEKGSIALTKLLMGPYWHRMWVFQEVVLAQVVVIHCGPFTAPWYGLQKLDEASADGKLWHQSQARDGWLFGLRKALFRISQFCIPLSEARHPTNVLQPTRGLQATDPRDKLFALLGVSYFGQTLVADYSKPVRDVYVEFATKYMEQNKSLALLLTAGLCQVNGPDIGLPSWTPDFRGLEGIDIRFLAASYLGNFDAAGPRPASFSFVDGHLQSEAVIIDEIEKTVLLNKTEASRVAVLTRLGQGKRGTRLKTYQDYFKTLVFYDRDFDFRDTDDPELKDIKRQRVKRLVLGFAYDWSTLLSDTVGKDQLQQDISDFLTFFPAMSSFLWDDYKTLLQKPETLQWYRKEYLIRSEETLGPGDETIILITKKGYVGKGPQILQAGDVVAILYGCKAPVILRKNDMTYCLVGPSYLGGSMSGEIFTSLSEDPSKFTKGSISIS